jgi:hypothetical protein
VEHFRPQAGYQQGDDDPLGRPGYYWLAYEWSNLLMACEICNQKFKGNLFPLEDPSRRATSHHEDVGRERPLLINPAETDPAQFIEFRDEYPHAIDNNPVGKKTIEVFRLDARPELIEQRRKLLAWIRLVVANRDLLAGEIDAGDTSPERLAQLAKIDDQLAACMHDSAEYAAMARAALKPRGSPTAGVVG